MGEQADRQPAQRAQGAGISHEGFSQGTVAALKQAESPLGSLADHIRVEADYVVPVEAIPSFCRSC